MIDRCGVCNGDGSSCLSGSRDNVARNSTSTKKAVTPGAVNLITSALDWLKHMGYDVDRRGQIASPEGAAKDTQKDDFYWAVVKSGCSVSCGGGNAMIAFLRITSRILLKVFRFAQYVICMTKVTSVVLQLPTDKICYFCPLLFELDFFIEVLFSRLRSY